MKEATSRKIVHIDMDAFYASVEQRDNPELRGKPIAVGGGEHRGVTTTASYEARVFGVRSAMPGWKAKQLCPGLIFVPPRFPAYKEVSAQIRDIFYSHTDLVEPLSLDEAYLDVTVNKKGIPHAMEVAKQIMEEVEAKTSLTCSAGVSYCKFLAKVASDVNKPNGLTIIRPSQAESFIEALPIKKFFGVGKVTAEKMENLGIYTGADLKKYSKLELAQRFGKAGSYFYNIVRGIDERPVKPNRIRKSLGVERTTNEDLQTLEEMQNMVLALCETFYQRLTRANNFGRTLTLKLKTSEFKTLTRSASKDFYIKDKSLITEMALSLLRENFNEVDRVRLIGLTASNLEQEKQDGQLEIEW